MKEKTSDIDILEEKEKEAIKDLEEYLHWEELQGFSMLPRDKHIETLLNLVSNLIAENKEKDEEIENQDKTIDRLVKEQEEREKYTHQLEVENKELKEMLKYRIEYTNKLEEDLFQNASNYVIPKSKVEELIEEFKPDSKETYNQENFVKFVEALQSLLGKE